MKPKTNVILVLDYSGSMSGHRIRLDQAVRDTVSEYCGYQADHDVRMSIYTFGNTVECNVMLQRPDTLSARTPHYRNMGGTALRDAMGKALAEHRAKHVDELDASYVMIVMTDGEENGSNRFTASSLSSALTEAQSTGRWTIAVQCPKGSRSYFLSLGMPVENVSEWDTTTAQGFQKAVTTNSVATQSYMTARSAGVKASTSFYVTPDLSSVTDKDLKSKLDDVTSRFKLYTVTKETRIDEFVESKTKKPYLFGQCFYQLMKTESRVQDDKEVVITRKNVKGSPIYGGLEARKLVGLQPGVVNKMKPGNHGDYDVFIQSKAPNRKLPTGTKVLIDVTKVKADHPTWVPDTDMDHI
jgi:uncharacterized protein YegL